jgi:hypothetical protein
MPHSIPAKFQPVPQWIVSDATDRTRRLGMGSVLFLQCAASVEPVEFDGLEAI